MASRRASSPGHWPAVIRTLPADTSTSISVTPGSLPISARPVGAAADRGDAAGFEFAIGGMTCAACAARVQTRLNKVEGVTAAVNYATERAHVTAPPGTSAESLAGVIEAAGYTAELARPADEDGDGVAAEDATVRRLRRRLYLALVFFIPLTDLSIVLSVFPWSRFPGWQWFLVALAAPVATWAAWPFHQAALKNARHLSSSMDTLVSMGIVAACGWSVYAMFFLDRSRARLTGLTPWCWTRPGPLPLAR
jgi:P-type Cu+ transporter